MSENHELLLMVLDTLTKNKKGDGGAPPGDARQSEMLILTVLDALAKSKKGGVAAPIGDARRAEIPNDDTPASERTPMPGAAIPNAPKQAFSWRNEAEISYAPGERGRRRADTASLRGGPTGGRREQRGTGAGPVFRMPTYRYLGESYRFGGQQGNVKGNSSAEPLRDTQRSSLGGSLRSSGSPYPPWPSKR